MLAKSLCRTFSLVLWLLSFKKAASIQQNPLHYQRSGVMHHLASQLQLASHLEVAQLNEDASQADTFLDQMFKYTSQRRKELKVSDGQPVELLRFITPYRTGLDSFVDVTPYSQLLKKGEPLHFYSFIDTWVGNNSMSHAAYMDNTSQLCTLVNHSDGNGWLLSADLIFSGLPQQASGIGNSLASVKGKISGSELLSLHPRAVVPLIDDTVSALDFGHVTMHEAVLEDNGVPGPLFVQTSKDRTTREALAQALRGAQTAPVYDCDKGKNALARSVLEMHTIDELSRLMGKGDNETISYEQELLSFRLGPSLVSLIANASNVEKRHVTVTFNETLVKPVKGLPVFFSGAFTDTWMNDDKMWWNQSTPFKPAGSILSVGNGTALVGLNCACVPNAENGWMPNLVMPKNEKSWVHAQAFLEKIKDHAQEKYLTASLATSNRSQTPVTLPTEGLLGFLDTSSTDSATGFPLLMKSQAETSFPNVVDMSQLSQLKSRVKATSLPGSSQKKKKVCVVTQQIHGRMLDKEFEMPALAEGERVIAQITSTGHGWASTQEQCGEYCKVKYHLKFDDGSPVEFMQWRDDCKDNPNGKFQHGTWFESRNGWCPGAVNPGVFVDVTHAVKGLHGKHRFTLDTLVHSSVSGEYEPFTDWDGWLYGDNANLRLAITLFIYPKEAIHAAQNEGRRSCTRASAALRSTSTTAGASWPADLTIQTTTPGDSLLRIEEVQCPLDFESRSPWYLWNVNASDYKTPALEKAALDSSTQWVSVMSRQMVQGSSRLQKVQLNPSVLPSNWGQVGLRLRLERPEGKLDFDHWDRIGSVGLLLQKKVKEATHPPDGVVEVGPGPAPQEKQDEKGSAYKKAYSFIVLFVQIVLSLM